MSSAVAGRLASTSAELRDLAQDRVATAVARSRSGGSLRASRGRGPRAARPPATPRARRSRGSGSASTDGTSVCHAASGGGAAGGRCRRGGGRRGPRQPAARARASAAARRRPRRSRCRWRAWRGTARARCRRRRGRDRCRCPATSRATPRPPSATYLAAPTDSSMRRFDLGRDRRRRRRCGRAARAGATAPRACPATRRCPSCSAACRVRRAPRRRARTRRARPPSRPVASRRPRFSHSQEERLAVYGAGHDVGPRSAAPDRRCLPRRHHQHHRGLRLARSPSPPCSPSGTRRWSPT